MGQFTKISGMRQYQTLGLVWFGKAPNDGIYHQDWRENDPQADAAFRLGPSELNLAALTRLAAARAGATGARVCALVSS